MATPPPPGPPTDVTLNVGPRESFTVISADTIEYKGERYTGVTFIQFPDGTSKTCAAIIAEAGGTTYSRNELRSCVKVELYDPDAAGRQVATIYSTNSTKAGKNETTAIPGGAWVEMFNFAGTKDTNHVLKIWADYFGALTPPVDYTKQYNPKWIGFKINYGTSAAHSYVMTYVNDFNEESMPCPPTDIGVTYMHAPKLMGKFQPLATITAGGIPHYYVPIRDFRLYRSNTGSSGQAIYQRVPVLPVSVFPNPTAGYFPRVANNPAIYYGFEFVDDKFSDELLEPLMTIDLEPPVPREMINLISWKNGMMVAFWGNTLKVCEPYRPYAWPYKYPLPRKILALSVDENALVVITDGDPYIFVGAHPSNLSYEAMQNVQGGIEPWPNPGGFIDRARSVVKTPAGIIYASREGPMIITSGRAKPLGRDLFTREDWLQVFGPDIEMRNMRLSFADARLIMWFSQRMTTGFQVNLDGGDFTYWDVGGLHYGAQVLPHDDSLYLLTSANGSTGELRRWSDEQAPRVVCQYWTREELLEKPGNMGALQVIGYGGTVKVLLWGDGGGVGTYDIDLSTGNANRPRVALLRPKAIRKSRRYSVQMILGINTVIREVSLANTVAELAGV